MNNGNDFYDIIINFNIVKTKMLCVFCRNFKFFIYNNLFNLSPG